MSFYPIEQAPGRLNRSELAIPGSQQQMFEKAEKLDVDLIFLDLEDAVAPDEIENAPPKKLRPSMRSIGVKNLYLLKQRTGHTLHVSRHG